jgi:hypothetical protein
MYVPISATNSNAVHSVIDVHVHTVANFSMYDQTFRTRWFMTVRFNSSVSENFFQNQNQNAGNVVCGESETECTCTSTYYASTQLYQLMVIFKQKLKNNFSVEM